VKWQLQPGIGLLSTAKNPDKRWKMLCQKYKEDKRKISNLTYPHLHRFNIYIGAKKMDAWSRSEDSGKEKSKGRRALHSATNCQRKDTSASLRAFAF